MTKTRFTRNAADVAHCFLSHCLRGWTLVDKPVCKAYTRPWLVPSWWNNGVKEAAPCLQHQVDPSETMWKKMSCAHQVHWADSTDISAHKVFWNCSFHCPGLQNMPEMLATLVPVHGCWGQCCSWSKCENMSPSHNSFSLYYQLKYFWLFLCCAQVICLLVPEPYKGLQIATGQVPL